MWLTAGTPLELKTKSLLQNLTETRKVSVSVRSAPLCRWNRRMSCEASERTSLKKYLANPKT